MSATIWKGRIVLGFVTVPVILTKAARRERVQFHKVYSQTFATASNVRVFPGGAASEDVPLPSDLARVHIAYVGKEPTTFVSKEALFKGYEYERDRWAAFRDSEIDALRPPTSMCLEISGFVGLGEIDWNYLETSYYVAPDHGGETGYAVLFRALDRKRCAATAELAFHGRQHGVIIRPGRQGLILHTLFFPHEVRADEEPRADVKRVSEKELELCEMLIEAKRTRFAPEKFKDKFEEELHQLIFSRCQEASTGANGADRSGARVIDMMSALRKSLELVRKPPQSERRGAGAPTRKKRPGKGQGARGRHP